jgi:hypothetical protein
MIPHEEAGQFFRRADHGLLSHHSERPLFHFIFTTKKEMKSILHNLRPSKVSAELTDRGQYWIPVAHGRCGAQAVIFTSSHDRTLWSGWWRSHRARHPRGSAQLLLNVSAVYWTFIDNWENRRAELANRNAIMHMTGGRQERGTSTPERVTSLASTDARPLVARP